jgi:hypothetical protein
MLPDLLHVLRGADCQLLSCFKKHLLGVTVHMLGITMLLLGITMHLLGVTMHILGITLHLLCITMHLLGVTMHLLGIPMHLLGVTMHLLGIPMQELQQKHWGGAGDDPQAAQKKLKQDLGTVADYASTHWATRLNLKASEETLVEGINELLESHGDELTKHAPELRVQYLVEAPLGPKVAALAAAIRTNDFMSR